MVFLTGEITNINHHFFVESFFCFYAVTTIAIISGKHYHSLLFSTLSFLGFFFFQLDLLFIVVSTDSLIWTILLIHNDQC